MLCAPFTKKRTHNLGSIHLQKVMCWKVWVCGRLVYSTEMAMRCSGVGGREVGLKCCDMHRCYVCWRTGVRCWWSMVQVTASAKTNRFSTGARQS